MAGIGNGGGSGGDVVIAESGGSTRQRRIDLYSKRHYQLIMKSSIIGSGSS